MRPPASSHPFPPAGFSLVEVALALGVIGFALLAIIGLLGSGVDSNRISIEETRAAAILTMLDADLRNTNPIAGKSAIYGLIPPYANASATTARAFNPAAGSAGAGQPPLLSTTGLSDAELPVNFSSNPVTRYQCSVVYYTAPTTGQVTPLRARLVVSWPGLATNANAADVTNRAKVKGYVETNVSFPAP